MAKEFENALQTHKCASTENFNMIRQLEDQLTNLKLLEIKREEDVNEMKKRHLMDIGSLQRKLNDYESQLKNGKVEQSELAESLKRAKETIESQNTKILDAKRAAIMKNNNIQTDKFKRLEESLISSEQLVAKLSSENQQLQQKAFSLECSVQQLQQEANQDLDEENRQLQNDNWDLAAQLDYSNIVMVEVMSQLKERTILLRTMNSMRLR